MSGIASASGMTPRPLAGGAGGSDGRTDSLSPVVRWRPSWPPKEPRSEVLRDPITTGTSTPP